MPTYEYLCSNCGNSWEEVQKISEPPVQICPKCSNATAKRQISGGSFILKGGGWYADLYSSSKPAKKDDGGESKGSAEGKETKETKEAASSPSKSEGKESAPAKTESAAPAKAPAAASGPTTK
jgi:putative FmdB family regulatory protein